MKVPSSTTCHFALGAADGVTLLEVCYYGPINKYVVVVVTNNGLDRRVESRRAMAYERAKKRATYLAGVYA